MTFTEIVFEVADERYPLCRLTATPSTASAIMRVLDHGRASGHFRTLVTFYGDEPSTSAVARELRASRQGGDIEVLSQTPSMVMLRTDSPVGDPSLSALRVHGVLRILESFGPDTILEPFLFRKGRIRARILVPRRIDTQRALVTLQDVQRQSGFADFRIVRVTSMQADRYLDLVRRILTPEQEDLLRLAASMGYYDTPKGATLEDIAGKVGLSVSPVHKRLKNIEETLVSAHVEGGRTLAAPRRRRPKAEVRVSSTAPCELAVRVRWAQSRVSQFVGATPGSRALLQVIGIDSAANQATFLLVVIAAEADYARLLEEFERRPDVLGVEMVERDRMHCSFKVRMQLAVEAGATTFPWWPEVWGDDAIMRPIVFEENDVMVRILVMRPMVEQEVRQRVERAAKLAGWQEQEIISARGADELRVPPVPAEPPTARQEEVLKIAHALGYYRTPRACTLEHVATTLGVSANAIHKNLSSAESKVITSYLSAGL